MKWLPKVLCVKRKKNRERRTSFRSCTPTGKEKLCRKFTQVHWATHKYIFAVSTDDHCHLHMPTLNKQRIRFIVNVSAKESVCSRAKLIPVNRSRLTDQQCPEEDTVTFSVVLSICCFPSNSHLAVPEGGTKETQCSCLSTKTLKTRLYKFFLLCLLLLYYPMKVRLIPCVDIVFEAFLIFCTESLMDT